MSPCGTPPLLGVSVVSEKFRGCAESELILGFCPQQDARFVEVFGQGFPCLAIFGAGGLTSSAWLVGEP
jgi:hypothetical protein